MSVRFARRLALGFFLAYTIFLTFPGAVPFNRIRPLVLGLPFSLFWVALWVVGAILMLWALDRAETAADATRRRTGADGASARPPDDAARHGTGADRGPSGARTDAAERSTARRPRGD